MPDTPSQLVTRPAAELLGRHIGYGFATGVGEATGVVAVGAALASIF